MVGGMVVFLEAENNYKLIKFYEEYNQFKKFSTRNGNSNDGQELIQLLKVLWLIFNQDYCI